MNTREFDRASLIMPTRDLGYALSYPWLEFYSRFRYYLIFIIIGRERKCQSLLTLLDRRYVWEFGFVLFRRRTHSSRRGRRRPLRSCRADWAVLNAMVGPDLVCHSRHNMNALFTRQRVRVAYHKGEARNSEGNSSVPDGDE